MRKGLFGILAAATLIHIVLFTPDAHSSDWKQFQSTKTADMAPTWKAFDNQTVDPKWDKFKKDHRGYEFWETEIYRGGQRSVNRFYLEN